MRRTWTVSVMLLATRLCVTMQMLMKSQLPFDTLGQIWKAADYDQV